MKSTSVLMCLSSKDDLSVQDRDKLCLSREAFPEAMLMKVKDSIDL